MAVEQAGDAQKLKDHAGTLLDHQKLLDAADRKVKSVLTTADASVRRALGEADGNVRATLVALRETTIHPSEPESQQPNGASKRSQTALTICSDA